MTSLRTSKVRGITATGALALFLTACGGGSTAAETEAPTTSTTDAAISEEGEKETAAPDESEAPDEPEENEEAAEDEATDGETVTSRPVITPVQVLALPAGPTSFPILGGIEFDLPLDAPGLQGDSCITIDQPGYDGPSPFGPFVLMAEIRYSGSFSQKPVDGIADWLALYGTEPEPEPTGETAEILGQQFTAYRVQDSFLTGPPPRASFLNCSTEEGVMSDLGILPGPYADAWAAEVDGGLLILSSDGYTAEEQLEARAMLDEILLTLDVASS